jgi:hypothetical protein
MISGSISACRLWLTLRITFTASSGGETCLARTSGRLGRRTGGGAAADRGRRSPLSPAPGQRWAAASRIPVCHAGSASLGMDPRSEPALRPAARGGGGASPSSVEGTVRAWFSITNWGWIGCTSSAGGFRTPWRGDHRPPSCRSRRRRSGSRGGHPPLLRHAVVTPPPRPRLASPRPAPGQPVR